MRVFGHPAHAIVVELPIGLLATVPLWDALARLGVEPRLALVGYYSELAGLVFAALAIVTGLLELLRPELTAALRSKALRHAGFALGASMAFAVAFALRRKLGPEAIPSVTVLGFEALGAAALGVTGYLGGDLVFGDGVGVRRDSTRG